MTLTSCTKLSKLLFLLSLCFPACYTGITQEAVPSLGLLLSGWLGILFGHFSWFANPLCIISWILKRSEPQLACFLSLLALAFSLSFLLYSELPDGHYGETITAYGIGYFFWVMSIYLFSMAQLNEYHGKKNLSALQFVILFFSTSVFIWHFFISDSSHYRIIRDRNKFFEQNCHKAKSLVFKTATNVSGVYFGPDLHRPGIDALNDYLKNGYLKFYEIDNSKDSSQPYLRYSIDNQTGIEVSDFKSEYSVIHEKLDEGPREELGISGSKITIIENSSMNTIATNVSFYSSIIDKQCGTYPRFLTEELNLKEKSFTTNIQ